MIIIITLGGEGDNFASEGDNFRPPKSTDVITFVGYSEHKTARNRGDSPYYPQIPPYPLPPLS